MMTIHEMVAKIVAYQEQIEILMGEIKAIQKKAIELNQAIEERFPKDHEEIAVHIDDNVHIVSKSGFITNRYYLLPEPVSTYMSSTTEETLRHYLKGSEFSSLDTPLESTR
jgi:hypothetical protein